MVLFVNFGYSQVFEIDTTKSLIENKVDFNDFKISLSGEYLQKFKKQYYTGCVFVLSGIGLNIIAYNIRPEIRTNINDEYKYSASNWLYFIGGISIFSGSITVISSHIFIGKSGNILQMKFNPVGGKILYNF